MGRPVNIGFVGQFPVGRPGADDDNAGDYRPVSASDDGQCYDDRGALGSYRAPDSTFAPPSDVNFASGFGAEESDMKRGYLKPSINDAPAYDLDNYKQRSTQPRLSDEDEGGDAMNDDWAFRRRNERARGFLTRPHIPTDR